MNAIILVIFFGHSSNKGKKKPWFEYFNYECLGCIDYFCVESNIYKWMNGYSGIGYF